MNMTIKLYCPIVIISEKKSNKIWLIYAYHRTSREIVVYLKNSTKIKREAQTFGHYLFLAEECKRQVELGR
jgi:IS1 family transposase